MKGGGCGKAKSPALECRMSAAAASSPCPSFPQLLANREKLMEMKNQKSIWGLQLITVIVCAGR